MQRHLDAFSERTFDLCILGGGITGAGVALDAATRGWSVALIDKGDFASGTSSASSKLIHGGLRYLEYGHLPLVHEALIERGRLLRNASQLVRPLPFLLPFYRGQRLAPWKWRLGLTLYDLLAGADNISRSRRLSARRLHAALPTLRADALLGGAIYHDALMDDARVTIAVLQTAAHHGAVLANYVEAVGFEKAQGQVAGVWARDHLTGQRFLIRSRAVLNATGPWADAVGRLAGDVSEPLLQPTKGVHLIVPDQGHRFAYLLLHPDDSRVFFVIPWLGKTLIGTTDTFPETGADSLQVTADEVTYLLQGYNRYLAPPLAPHDVLGTFAGLRPLIRARPGEPSSLSREFRLHVSPSGLVTALGGKFTTFRQMAETIVDLLDTRLGQRRRCRTRELRLAGAPSQPWSSFEREGLARLRSEFDLPIDCAAHLLQRHGEVAFTVAERIARTPAGFARAHPEEPDLLGEEAYAREAEMAVHPADVWLRRTRVGLWRPQLLNR